MVLKLKVVGPDGTSNPSLVEAVKRNIFLASPIGYLGTVLLAVVTGLASLVGVIMIAVGIANDTPNRQAWHDKFAGGTRVLKIG